MASDRLYDLALTFRKTKLWKQLYDTELFAFSLSDRTIAYCCVMGNKGEHLALGVYVGQKGIDSYRKILHAPNSMTPAQTHEMMFSQSCLQCSFEEKYDLSEEQLAEARDYAKRKGISYRGKNAFPCFISSQPHHVPWPMEGERNETILCEALSAALAVAELLQQQDKETLGFRPCIPCEGEIPFLERKSFGGASISKVMLPEPVPETYPEPDFQDELALKRLSRLKKSGTWLSEIVWMNQPVRPEDGGAPHFPVFLLCWNRVSEMLAVTELVSDIQTEADKLLLSFTHLLTEHGGRPETILVRDERTYAFLRKLSDRLGIHLEQNSDLPELDEAEEDFYSDLNEELQVLEDLSTLTELLSHLSAGELAQMPPELREQLEMLDQAGMLPDELSVKLNKPAPPKHKTEKMPVPMKQTKQKTGKKRGRKRKYSDISYVISVSLGTGCYRHIRISGAETLNDLSDAILDAFEFANDHMHMFCMDNRTWGSGDVYISEPDDFDDEPERDSHKYRLGQLILTIGQKFKYVFDFGDEWVFQCKVLKVLDEETGETAVVRSKGEAPAQYGGYGEEEDWIFDDE